MSLNSGEQDAPDDEALFLGAGGVYNDPAALIPNAPLGLGTTKEGILRHPQPEPLCICPSAYHLPREHGSDCSGTGSPRQMQLRSSTTSPSPLQQVAFESDLNETRVGDDFDDDDSDSSFFRDTHQWRRQVAAIPSQVPLYRDSESDEEGVPIEVKRRRPSLSVTSASPPPLSDSDFSDEHRSRS